MPTPESVLGYRVGADRKLADWGEITGYFAKLAAATPAVSIETLGQTTMGKPLIAAIISTPENVRRREAIFAGQRKLADPRMLKTADEAELYAHQPAVLVIQCNIHADRDRELADGDGARVPAGDERHAPGGAAGTPW